MTSDWATEKLREFDEQIASLELNIANLEGTVANLRDQVEFVRDLRAIIAGDRDKEREQRRKEGAPATTGRRPRAKPAAKRAKPSSEPQAIAADAPPHPPPPTPGIGSPEVGTTASLASMGLGRLEEPDISEAQVRDVLCRRDDLFTERVLMDAFDINRLHARRLLVAYVERDIIEHVSGRAAQAKYRYIPPDGSTTPTRKPRGEVTVAGAGRAQRGDPVAHTGRLPGPSGKPGLDAARSRKIGRKVGRGRY